MREFFLTWRRDKVGIAALVIACLLTIGWIKSKFVGDQFLLYTGIHTIDTIISMDGSLMWTTYREDDRFDPWMASIVPTWRSAAFFASSDMVDAPTVEWHWRFRGFGSCTNHNLNGTETTGWIIPYWFVTIPIFLVAALTLASRKPEVESHSGKPS